MGDMWKQGLYFISRTSWLSDFKVHCSGAQRQNNKEVVFVQQITGLIVCLILWSLIHVVHDEEQRQRYKYSDLVYVCHYLFVSVWYCGVRMD